MARNCVENDEIFELNLYVSRYFFCDLNSISEKEFHEVVLSKAGSNIERSFAGAGGLREVCTATIADLGKAEVATRTAVTRHAAGMLE